MPTRGQIPTTVLSTLEKLGGSVQQAQGRAVPVLAEAAGSTAIQRLAEKSKDLAAG